MDTSNLKRFAQTTRIRLLEAVQDKLEYVLNHDAVDLRDYAASVHTLKKDVERIGKEALIDKVAYTWFNRLMALRFMDANGYQPLRLMVISPKEGFTQPETLDEAMRGYIPEELRVDKTRINDLLDGKITSPNPQNEVYRMLLVASCNYLHSLFPFLFEQLNDYTELLLPDDLISELSIIHDFVEGMTQEDCQEVEVMGWLYQFYIADRKEEVFAAKGRVKKEDIPSATQLFTPRWIVEYMLQNTVSKLWLQNNPHSSLRKKMPYYIETDASKSDDFLKISSPEELTLLDQACGSGHILVYGFELLYHIYEEAGYMPSQIPQLIIEKNLYGYEIDERAAQLASFTVLMKARSYYPRLFSNPVQPNVLCYQDLELSEEEVENSFALLQRELTDELRQDLLWMQQATNLGSLIQPQTEQAELIELERLLGVKTTGSDIFEQQQYLILHKAVSQLRRLGEKFCCVVDNPPYMGGGNMNKALSDFVKTYYPLSKADLMACFMESGIAALKPNGMLGMINQHSWMFLSSFEKLREELIKNAQFDTLLHLGPRTFPEIGGEVVQNAAFTFINREPNKKSSYIRLIDYKDTITKSEKTLEAIQNPDCGWFYTKNQKDFEKIIGFPISYFFTDTLINVFNENKSISEISEIRKGISTSNNNYFLRLWFEVSRIKMSKTENPRKELVKWVKANKGGQFRKYFGNLEYVLNWENNGGELEDIKPRSVIRSPQHFFKEILAFSKISSSSFSVRRFDKGLISIDASSYFVEYNNGDTLLGLLNSKIFPELLGGLTPTLNFEIGDISKLPVVDFLNSSLKTNIEVCVSKNISISRFEWNSRETSWDFQQNVLIRFRGQDIEEAVELYKMYWTKQFFQLHQNEEELNKEFIHIYGLEEELTPDVALEDITLLRDELDQRILKELSVDYRSGWQLNSERKWELPAKADYPELPFDEKELVMQLISYAVGCMFGRYSIDKKGLILANQGDGVQEYYAQLGDKEQLRFVLDEDAVIPVLDEEWFEDDIVAQFRRFVRVVWGKENLQRNLEYMERVLGKPLRNYFYRDFYNDHIKRYKRRPIYWMVASSCGEFQALIYLHRYSVDTLSHVLNDYLRPYIAKLESRIDHLNLVAEEGVAREKTRAVKEIARLEKIIDELRVFDRMVLYPLATERISIDLDDGVLVNYNILGQALKTVSGLNDVATKKRVRNFDWIDVEQIRG